MDRKMLIVDDVESNRVILKEMFKNNYAIIEASNGEDAVDIAIRNQDTLSIILLDLIMPKMNGFEVLERLSKENLLIKIPTIVITAAGSDETESKVLDIGAYDVIRKPYVTNIVKRRVENVVNSYRYSNNLENIAKSFASEFNSDITSSESHDDMMKSLYNFDYYKYITMLKILDRFCLEIDLINETYSVRYPIGENPYNLRVNGTVDGLMDEFVKKYFHKDDMKRAMAKFYMLSMEISNGGIGDGMGYYRILNEKTGQYEWNSIAFMRVDMNNQRFQNVVSLFKNINDIPYFVERAEKSLAERMAENG